MSNSKRIVKLSPICISFNDRKKAALNFSGHAPVCFIVHSCFCDVGRPAGLGTISRRRQLHPPPNVLHNRLLTADADSPVVTVNYFLITLHVKMLFGSNSFLSQAACGDRWSEVIASVSNSLIHKDPLTDTANSIPTTITSAARRFFIVFALKMGQSLPAWQVSGGTQKLLPLPQVTWVLSSFVEEFISLYVTCFHALMHSLKNQARRLGDVDAI